MRNYYLCLVLLIVAACKNDKNENGEPTTTETTYVDKVVGKVENGEFLISDLGFLLILFI